MFFFKLHLPRLPFKLQLILLGLIFALIAYLLFFSPRQKSSLGPSPDASIPVDSSTLQVISSNPKDSTYHQPNQPLSLTFNQFVNPQSLSVRLEPSTPITLSIGTDNSTILITPSPKFLPETNYVLFIDSLSFTLRFTTYVEAGNLPNWNENFNQELDQFVKTTATQDNALRTIRRTAPITLSSFTLLYSYKDNTYTIQVASPFDLNKTTAINWLKNQGVTDLSHLKINWEQL